MKKTVLMILFLLLLPVVFNSNISANEIVSGNSYDDKESVNNTSTEYEERLYSVIKELSVETRSINSMKDISELFALSPEIHQYVLNKETLFALQKIQNTENTTDFDKLVNLLINYIESDYKLSSLEELRSYVTIYIRTINGNEIVGKRKSYSDENRNYNCHSFAWYYGGNYNSSDRIWIDDPYGYYRVKDSYCCITQRLANQTLYPSTLSAVNVEAGDIIVFVAYSDETELPVAANRVKHSVIVSHKQGGTIYVKSKNGEGSMTTQALGAVSSTYRIAHGGPHHGQEREIIIYRRNHWVNSSAWTVNQNYHYLNSTYHEYSCQHCARNYKGVETHTFVSYGAIRKCACGYQIVNQNKSE